MAKFKCIVCDYIYDEVEGDDSQKVLPGTTWEGLSDDWVCPLCGVGKDQFEPID